ncbi:hypothetical protein BP5796_12932 [Coleophoma crateriformis]|uniref:NAD(P)-binding protein n=1 Tax=Coleophoma crateriformis TaxID=565419 RepID=A0A3D8Q4U7_9HELO|nr:hypothetical protein BP5796_12932 [Coleophoma crateriformis]
MSSYLITGVPRGIGFEFLRQISADPNNTVVGLVRDKATTDKKVAELNRQNIHIVQADLTDYDSLKKSVDEVSPIVNGALGYVIANAGYISSWSAYDPLSVFLSSGFADDELTTGFAIDVAGPYTISKAAMNTAVAKYSAEYAESGVLFMSIAPGAVEVGQDKDITPHQIEKGMALVAKFARYAPNFRGRTTPEDSVKSMMSVMNGASLESGHGGCFVSQSGNKQWL